MTYQNLKKLLGLLFVDVGFQHWFPAYLWSRTIRSRPQNETEEPIHIMFCLVDHYEPFHGGVDFNVANKRVQTWEKNYPIMAEKHRDSDGNPPKHTWFYPPHLDHCFLNELAELCQRGFGEIEMHLHHNRMHPFPDTSKTLTEKIIKCISDYSKHGIFCLPDGSKKFAFIHGDWSLDNSLGSNICGVNDEIKILRKTGCYADFTYPSLGKAQPAFMNRIYYVKDDPQKPKSYNWGKEIEVGGKPWGDLLLIPGILGIRKIRRNGRLKWALEASDLDGMFSPDEERIDYWVANALTVRGKSNWKFIKLHTHGAVESRWKSLLFEGADSMYRYLTKKYNDRYNYFLHFVTAREMYNVIKAAENGEHGNPNYFRDYEIPRYTYLD